MTVTNIIFGPDQEIFSTYAGNASTALTDAERRGFFPGQRMILHDGREFRWAKAGAVALVAGDVLQASAPISAHVGLTPTAGAVGDKTLTVAFATTAISADQYRDGYALVEDGTGFGYLYPIDRHPAVASATGSFAIPFKSGFSLQVAVPATATSVSLISNPYQGVIQAPVSASVTAQLVGVAVKPLAIAAWGWIQTKGVAAVTTQGTLIIGNPCAMSATTAGTVSPIPTTFVADGNTQQVGRVVRVAVTTKKSAIDLTGFA